MMRHIALLAAGLVMQVFALGAPVTSNLVGRVVRAGASARVPGAEVTLAPRAARVVTDATGEFRFDDIPVGRYTILVRQLRFHPESLGVAVPLASGTDLTIVVRETAQPLDTVAVTGRDELLARGKLGGFYERKKFGIGRFLEAKDIEKYLTRRLADIIVATMPGTRAVRGKGGMAAHISTFRMAPHALVGASAAPGQTTPPGGAFSSRGPRPTQCYPDVYLDGVVVYSSGLEMDRDAGDVRFDVNSIDPSHVSAIEFYGGAAQMPAQFNRTGAACGALLIWTK